MCVRVCTCLVAAVLAGTGCGGSSGSSGGTSGSPASSPAVAATTTVDVIVQTLAQIQPGVSVAQQPAGVQALLTASYTKLDTTATCPAYMNAGSPTYSDGTKYLGFYIATNGGVVLGYNCSGGVLGGPATINAEAGSPHCPTK